MKKLRTLKEWAAAVRLRDGKCMVCGTTSGLVAHHIKPKSQYPELKFDVSNGQTLCVDCHKEHHKEHPVSGVGKGVISKVWLKKRIKELEREVAWMKETTERALGIVRKNDSLEEEVKRLTLANNKLIHILRERNTAFCQTKK